MEFFLIIEGYHSFNEGTPQYIISIHAKFLSAKSAYLARSSENNEVKCKC